MASISYKSVNRLLIITLLFSYSISMVTDDSSQVSESDLGIPSDWIEEVSITTPEDEPKDTILTDNQMEADSISNTEQVPEPLGSEQIPSIASDELIASEDLIASDEGPTDGKAGPGVKSFALPEVKPREGGDPVVSTLNIADDGNVTGNVTGGVNGGPAGALTTFDTTKLVELCDKPVLINAANRYPNGTVRIYRDQNYWDLMGLPDKVGFTGPKQTLWSPIGPVSPKTAITTIYEGSPGLKGRTLKFEKQFIWVWDETGKQERGGKGGELWSDIPAGGFDAMIHNGNDTKPYIIAFKDDLVYYISTKEADFEFLDPDGKKGGKFKENYPPNIRAAFSWMIGKVPHVFMFRDDKYCLRPVGPTKSGKDCDEWSNASELFGCKETLTTGPNIVTGGAGTGIPDSVVTTGHETNVPDSEPNPGEPGAPSINMEALTTQHQPAVAAHHSTGYQTTYTRYSYSLPICFLLLFPILFH